jgi:hypothetical protein
MTKTNNNEEEDLLDESWIKNFEKNDKKYEDFYKDNIYYVTINIIYVNKENNIEKINNEVFLMKNPNIISREEIIGIIKRNLTSTDEDSERQGNYSFLSMLKYNFSLNPEEMNIFLKTKDFDDYNSQFFTSLKDVDTIIFEKTINMFQDLNTLFIIFYEKDKDNTKHPNLLINKNNHTKKIYLRTCNQKNKRTLRA